MKRTTLLLLLTAALLVLVTGRFWLRHRSPAPETSPALNPVATHIAANAAPSEIVRRPHVRWQWMKELSTNAPGAGVVKPGTETWQPVPLSREQIEQFVAQEHRSAASLLAAFTLAQDASFLVEAAEHFPDDPKVQLAVLGMDAFPGERERWLDAFQQSAPDNALANYLAALDSLRHEDTEQALLELTEAGNKAALNFYSDDTTRELVNAYRASGLPEGAALMSAMTATPLPHLVEMRELAKAMESLIAQANGKGDVEGADALRRSGLALAGQIRSGGKATWLLEELVGISIEKMFLNTLDPSATLDDTRKTAGQRLAELQSRRQKIADLAQAADMEKSLLTLSDDEMARYFTIATTEGEYHALLWLRDRQKQHR